MSLAMYAAPFDDNSDSKNSENDYIKQKKQAHNKTQKRYPKENFDTFDKNKVNNVLQQIHDNLTNDDESGLGEFNPPPKPESIGAQRKKIEEGNNIEQMGNMSSNSDNNMRVLGKSPDPAYQERSNDNLELNNFDSNYGDNNNAEEYYRKMLPGYNNPHNRQYYNSKGQTNTSPSSANVNVDGNFSNDLLLQKINYMINLLEEQQDEKTNNVTEEVVLYSFLGIFIIFVVDSFARVGKYVR
jgi:hypothetical protein